MRWGILVGILLLLGFYALLTLLSNAFPKTEFESLSAAHVEAIGQFKIPPGTQNVRSYLCSWMDFELYVRFTIPPDQVDALLASTDIRGPLSSTVIYVPARGSPSWWLPGTPAQFESGDNQSALAPSTVPSSATSRSGVPSTQPRVRQCILIDKTNPKSYVVWFMAQ